MHHAFAVGNLILVFDEFSHDNIVKIKLRVRVNVNMSIADSISFYFNFGKGHHLAFRVK